MAGFNDFVQIELPKRPYTEGDGNPGDIPVRSADVNKIRELVFISPQKLAASLGITGGVAKRHDFVLTQGISDYELPYPAVASVYQMFLNGLLSSATLVSGNKVRVTEFPADKIEGDDEMVVFYIV